MLRLWEPSNVWPSAVWEDLPDGAKWLVVQQAPVPYLLVRRRGEPDHFFKAWVGRPVSLSPAHRYQMRAIANPDIDLYTSPGANATFTWKNRKCLVLLSSHENPEGGIVHLAWRAQNANASGVTITPVRITTEGLRSLYVTWDANGTISYVIIDRYDPDAPAAGTNENRSYVAVGANVPRNMIWSFGAVNADLDDNAVSIPGHAGIPRGTRFHIVFAVTTTPIVACSVEGRLV